MSPTPTLPSEVWLQFLLTLVVAALGGCVTALLVGRPAGRVRFSARTANLVFGAMLAAWVLVFGSLAILRFASFHAGASDLAIFDQNVWNALQGRPFQVSVVIESPNVLGQHFSPLLMALAPVYAVWNDVRAMLAVQTLCLGLAAVPIFLYARRELGPGLAVAVAAAYFLYPPVQFVNLADFHELSLAVPLLSLAVYFLLERRHRPLLVFLGLALLAKEEIGLIVAAFGVFIFLVQRRRMLGTALAVGGVAWTLMALLVVIPSFRDPVHGAVYQYTDRYGYLGATVPEIITTAITQPWLVVQHMVTPAAMAFLGQLLAPLAFIPVLGAEVLALAAPTLVYLLMGEYAGQVSIKFQYTALITPVVFFALSVGLRRLLLSRALKLRPAAAASLAALLVVGGLANYYFQAPGPLASQFTPSTYAITDHVRAGERLLARIPPGAAVVAESGLVPHISHRRLVYQPSVIPDLRQIDYLLADTTAPLHAEYAWFWRDVLATPFFEEIASEDGFILKRRAEPRVDQPLQIAFTGGIGLAGYSVQAPRPAVRGATAGVVLVWAAIQPVTVSYKAFVHLVDAQGRLWAQDDRSPANGWLDTARWRPGDRTPDLYTLAIPAWMPPGVYTMTAGLYEANSGQRLAASSPEGRSLGTEPVLGNITVGAAAPAGQPPAPRPEVASDSTLAGLRLLGHTGLPGQLLPGSELRLGLYWQAGNVALPDLSIALILLRPDGSVAAQKADRPVAGMYPTIRWTPGEMVLDWRDWRLPVDLAGGEYRLVAQAVDAASGSRSGQAGLGTLHITPIDRVFTPPAVGARSDALLGGRIRLAGYEEIPQAGALQVRLWWQATAEVDTPYTVFAHLTGADGRVLAQRDQQPAGGSRPTTTWLPGEYIADAHTLALPVGLPPGAYGVQVGLYDPVTGLRLKAVDGSDHVDLPAFRVR